MEMVIEGVKNKEAKDIEQWEGVIVENSKVVKINCRDCSLPGSVHLEWLPSSVKKFLVGWNHKITGTLDCASLPTAMKELLLGINAFTGSIGLERLPERMEEIYVFHN